MNDLLVLNKVKDICEVVGEYEEVTIAGSFCVIETIFQELVKTGLYHMMHIELCSEDIDAYEDEYCIDIDCDNGLYVRKAIGENDEYLYNESDVLLYHPFCNDELLEANVSEVAFAFVVKEMDADNPDAELDEITWFDGISTDELIALNNNCEECNHDVGFSISGHDDVNGDWHWSCYATDEDTLWKAYDKFLASMNK